MNPVGLGVQPYRTQGQPYRVAAASCNNVSKAWGQSCRVRVKSCRVHVGLEGQPYRVTIRYRYAENSMCFHAYCRVCIVFSQLRARNKFRGKKHDYRKQWGQPYIPYRIVPQIRSYMLRTFCYNYSHYAHDR
jgi:hypothetical protein